MKVADLFHLMSIHSSKELMEAYMLEKTLFLNQKRSNLVVK